MYTKGYAAIETKDAFEQARTLIERAEALGEAPEDPLAPFSVIYGFWLANAVAFKADAVRELAAQILSLAEKQGAAVPLAMGHRMLGFSLVYSGDLSEGRAHLDRAIGLYDPIEHRPKATRFGVDVRAQNLSYRSQALWMLGYPGAALADAEFALKDAREIGRAVTLMYALIFASMTNIHCRDYATATAHADEVVGLANEKDAPFWKAGGIALQGCALALTASDAVHMITSGVTAYRSTGATLWVPVYLSYLAKAHADLGQFDDARRCIGEAMTATETSGERWFEAELHRVAGEIEWMSPERDAAKAETHFERALEVARAQQAKSWELRAATSLGASSQRIRWPWMAFSRSTIVMGSWT